MGRLVRVALILLVNAMVACGLLALSAVDALKSYVVASAIYYATEIYRAVRGRTPL